MQLNDVSGAFDGALLHEAHLYRRVHVKMPSFQGNLIIVCVVQSLALSTTGLRLLHKLYTRKLWWDDLWASLALFHDTMLFCVFLTLRNSPIGRTKTVDNFGMLMVLLTYTTTLWTSRLTISVTITRLLSDGRMRKASKVASYVFVIFWVTLLFQKIFFCGKNWHIAARCTIPPYTAILELSTDITADMWLLAAPIYMLFQMKLRRTHRRMIIAIFACGIFITFSSIAHSVFILLHSPVWIGISGHVQISIAMIVSNLLVLVTAVYRAMRRRAARAGNTTAPNDPTDSASPNDTATRALDAGANTRMTETYFSSHISLTDLSHLGSSLAPHSESFASTAPFSSFSYPSSHAQSGQSSVPSRPGAPRTRVMA